MDSKPLIKIEYCTDCRWMLRAAWYAQKLLSSFELEIGGVILKPGSGGIFEIRLEDRRLWSRAEDGGFPDIKRLKQRVRDMASPGRDMGHVDR